MQVIWLAALLVLIRCAADVAGDITRPDQARSSDAVAANGGRRDTSAAANDLDAVQAERHKQPSRVLEADLHTHTRRPLSLLLWYNQTIKPWQESHYLL